MELQTFLELAENKLKYASKKDRTINIKVAINTARMMVESEKGGRLFCDCGAEMIRNKKGKLVCELS